MFEPIEQLVFLTEAEIGILRSVLLDHNKLK